MARNLQEIFKETKGKERASAKCNPERAAAAANDWFFAIVVSFGPSLFVERVAREECFSTDWDRRGGLGVPLCSPTSTNNLESKTNQTSQQPQRTKNGNGNYTNYIYIAAQSKYSIRCCCCSRQHPTFETVTLSQVHDLRRRATRGTVSR